MHICIHVLIPRADVNIMMLPNSTKERVIMMRHRRVLVLLPSESYHMQSCIPSQLPSGIVFLQNILMSLLVLNVSRLHRQINLYGHSRRLLRGKNQALCRIQPVPLSMKILTGDLRSK